ncbi:hypothetical protein, partial [Paenibacillus sp. GCM10027626]|uniref:RCC1 domain-containing protein n=1 Tax=Paenibacillus sp. GCM10027626 TaxID=3273411 RepID=UPI003637970D
MKGLRFNKVLTIVIMNILVFLLLLCPISVYADSLYQYEYDDSNRLISITQSDGTKIRFEYDENGNLVKQKVGGIVVTAGSSHGLQLKGNGTVWAWGANTYGQIGDGTTKAKSTAVQVNGLSGITRTAAGGNHSLALKNDGTVWAWGLNTDGELGDGTTTNRTSPVQIPNLTSVIAITAGSNYSMAVKDDGTVWAWGNNSNGKLGDGTTARRTSPVQVKSLNSIIEISAGESHTLALRNDGTIWAWGLNSNGQLGNGKNGSNSSVNTAIQVPGMSGVAEVAAGRYYSMALKKDGTVWTWGHNVYGQLGDGTSTSTNIPAPVQGLTGVKHISASVNEHALSLVVKQDGTVWSWGANTYGQIGDGTMMLRWNPVQVIGLSGVERIATGDYYNLAMKADGSVWAWGLNSSGQLGNGSTINSSVPIATVMNTAPIVTLTTPSGSQTNPTPTRVTRPTIVWNQEDAALTTFSAIQVQLFDETTTLIYDSGIVEQNVTGSVGDFTVPVDLPEGKLQVRVKVSDGTKWSEWSDSRWMLIDTMIDITPMVAAGSSHSLELKSDGTVWAWGANTYGQIGDGSTTTKSTAVQVNGLSGITRTAAGGNHSLALKNDGTVWAWGLNTDGEL